MTIVEVTGDRSTASLSKWRTRLSVTVRRPRAVDAVEVAERVLVPESERLERATSRFREDSELSRVNRSPAQWTDVSLYFLTVLTAALDAAEQTDGLVDPCVGALVDQAGYRIWRDGAQPLVPTPATPADRDTSGSGYSREQWRHIEIRPNGERGFVRIPRGCQLDLGAIAKAWLADRIAMRVTADFEWDVIANMGGDLRAVGREQPWTIAADPGIPGIEASAINVTDAGLATSSQGRRRWTTAGGNEAHHIIDPRTGTSAITPWWSASVLASTAQGANSASTAAMILGGDAPTWLDRHSLDAWLVASQDATARTTTIGRWPTRPSEVVQ